MRAIMPDTEPYFNEIVLAMVDAMNGRCGVPGSLKDLYFQDRTMPRKTMADLIMEAAKPADDHDREYVITFIRRTATIATCQVINRFLDHVHHRNVIPGECFGFVD